MTVKKRNGHSSMRSFLFGVNVLKFIFPIVFLLAELDEYLYPVQIKIKKKEKADYWNRLPRHSAASLLISGEH